MSPAADTPKMLHGRCRCGVVAYEVEDAFLYSAYCHCANCRAITGSAFSAFAGIERDKLRIVSGEDRVSVLGDADAGARFCSLCGGYLFAITREGAYVHVQMGTLVDAPMIRPSEHIFVASKAPWHDITDDLPQFDEFPG